MGITVVILIGLFLGWLVAAYLEFDEGMFAHMALGACGALIGGVVCHMLMPEYGLKALSWSLVLWSIGGALLVTTAAGYLSQSNKNSGV